MFLLEVSSFLAPNECVMQWKKLHLVPVKGFIKKNETKSLVSLQYVLYSKPTIIKVLYAQIISFQSFDKVQ